MTIINPEPHNTREIEPKVKWATFWSYVVGVVALAIVEAFTANENELLIAALPDYLEAFVLPILPSVTVLIAGYVTRHQWRNMPRSISPGPGRSTGVG